MVQGADQAPVAAGDVVWVAERHCLAATPRGPAPVYADFDDRDATRIAYHAAERADGRRLWRRASAMAPYDARTALRVLDLAPGDLADVTEREAAHAVGLLRFTKDRTLYKHHHDLDGAWQDFDASPLLALRRAWRADLEAGAWPPTALWRVRVETAATIAPDGTLTEGAEACREAARRSYSP